MEHRNRSPYSDSYRECAAEQEPAQTPKRLADGLCGRLLNRHAEAIIARRFNRPRRLGLAGSGGSDGGSPRTLPPERRSVRTAARLSPCHAVLALLTKRGRMTRVDLRGLLL
jgi:hypothetical protein